MQAIPFIRAIALRAMILTFLAFSVLTVSVGRADAASASTTFVTMVSDSEYLGQGISQMFHPDNGTVNISGDASYLTVAVDGGTSSNYFSLVFAAPEGQQLEPGAYEQAERAPYRNTGHPGLDIYGEGRECNTLTGRFTVHDIAVDLSGEISAFWATYEQHCSAGSGRALIGEVRINEPGGDSDLIVANGVIDWPETYPGANGIVVPVWLVNTGSTPVRVSSTSLSGSNPGDFSVLSNGCSTDIAPGQICAIFTRFTPIASGPRGALLTLTDTTATGYHTTTLTGRGIAGHTALIMRSQEGDGVGLGSSYDYAPANATMSINGTPNSVSVWVEIGSQWWVTSFEAPEGEILTPGTYPGATRAFSTDGVGLDVRGYGRGCWTLTGTFTIIEAVFKDGAGAPQKFAATFEQHCEGEDPALFGWVSYRATDANEPPAGPPEAVTGLDAYTQIGSSLVYWNDPTASNYDTTIVRVAEGSTYPTLNSGVEVYRGSEGSMVLDYLTPGATYAISVWTMDVDGDLSAPTHLRLRGSDLTLRTSATTVTYGGTTNVTGTLVDGATGDPVSGHAVDIFTRKHGTTAYAYHSTQTTLSTGKVTVTLKPTRSTDVTISYHGESLRLGSESGSVSISVRAKVVASLTDSGVLSGGSTKIKGSVAPNHSGQSIKLQRYYSGAWHTVNTHTLSSTSSFSFTINPVATGTRKYRVYKAADSDHLSGWSPTRTLTVT